MYEAEEQDPPKDVREEASEDPLIETSKTTLARTVQQCSMGDNRFTVREMGWMIYCCVYSLCKANRVLGALLNSLHLSSKGLIRQDAQPSGPDPA